MPLKPPSELPPSIQAKLELGDTQLRPLGDVNTAMRDLNLDSDEVRMLVQLGYLVAFNIAASHRRAAVSASPRHHCKSELRVLTRSIEQFRAVKTKRLCAYEWPQIFRLIVPHQKPELKGTEIQRVLNCDRGLVATLVAAKQLVALQKTKRGPGGTWTISRASLESFLKNHLQ